MENTQLYDSIIIGNGPAGITSAIYLKRAGYNPLVISKKESSLLKASEVENYYGFIEPISGEELYLNGINQAKRLNIELIEDEVLAVEYGINGYKVSTKTNAYTSRTIIFATGMVRNIPVVKNLSKYEGKGVSYCAVCDGFFFRNKNVAILGNKEYALHEAQVLLPLASKVTILTNGKDIEFENNDNIEVITTKINELSGETILEEVSFNDGSTLKINGLFIALGTASSADFAKKLGAAVENHKIVINDKMETNIPGIYAAGDTTDGMLQIAKAVYQGAEAAMSAIKYLKK